MSSGVARCRVETAEKIRSRFEKTNIRNYTNMAVDAVEKTSGEVDEAADEGRRQRLQFYEGRG